MKFNVEQYVDIFLENIPTDESVGSSISSSFSLESDSLFEAMQRLGASESLGVYHAQQGH